jgi:diguanylate cyclase (GGDEF)-like protein
MGIKMFRYNRYDKERDRRDKLVELKEKNKQLRTLIEINTYIANSLEKEEVLKRILNQTKILLNCESSSILLVDRGLMVLNFAVLSKDEEGDILKDTSLRMGEGIAGTVWQNGIPILINDAQNDPRFSDRADKKAKTKTRSVIAVPLTVNGEIIGVIEAINKMTNGFSHFDLQVLQFVSTQSAIAINNADLYDNAIRDGMTKLFINKYFRERLQEEWFRSLRRKHHLSVGMFDIDNFKGINDTYGHQAGDRVIKEVAAIMIGNCRSIDIPCRYGGEEFSIILPETERDEAMAFADRLRNIAAGLRLEYEDISIHFSISGGIATIPDLAPNDPRELIDMADMALYYSKNHGRNRISFFDPVLMQKQTEAQ